MDPDLTLGGGLVLADDDPDDRFLITRALRRCRADLPLHAVRDGIELMEHLRACLALGAPLPRLVLLDLNMPRMDGREVLGALKADVRLRALPVVVLTTSVEPEDLRRSREQGAASFISKPEEFAQMVRVMQGLIDQWCPAAHLPAEAL